MLKLVVCIGTTGFKWLINLIGDFISKTNFFALLVEEMTRK
jgi:hypothetical protein